MTDERRPLLKTYAPRPAKDATVDDVAVLDTKDPISKAIEYASMIDDEMGGKRATIRAFIEIAKENKRLWDLLLHRAYNMENERKRVKRSGRPAS